MVELLRVLNQDYLAFSLCIYAAGVLLTKWRTGRWHFTHREKA